MAVFGIASKHSICSQWTRNKVQNTIFTEERQEGTGKKYIQRSKKVWGFEALKSIWTLITLAQSSLLGCCIILQLLSSAYHFYCWHCWGSLFVWTPLWVQITEIPLLVGVWHSWGTSPVYNKFLIYLWLLTSGPHKISFKSFDSLIDMSVLIWWSTVSPLSWFPKAKTCSYKHVSLVYLSWLNSLYLTDCPRLNCQPSTAQLTLSFNWNSNPLKVPFPQPITLQWTELSVNLTWVCSIKLRPLALMSLTPLS